MQLIRDPVKIQQIAFEMGMAARDEILIIYSTANAFYHQMKLGTIQSLKEVVEERGVKTRILTPKEPLIDKTIQKICLSIAKNYECYCKKRRLWK